MNDLIPDISDSWIISKRGNRNPVDPMKPYAWMVEKERTPSGSIEDTGIIFLTNRECPFHCLMCDLWKNTTEYTVPGGSIPAQIVYALERMPDISHIKLYNSGSFFDPNAIPREDYPNIAALLQNFKTVIVESHPCFVNQSCVEFRDMLVPELHVALGLETVHPELLKRIHKKMNPESFSEAVGFLNSHQIRSRAFILVKPPFLTEEEGVFWAKQSIDFAFSVGVECCVVIPVRPGNGAMDFLQEKGWFSPPTLNALEEVLEYGIARKQGRVFADTWDLKLFSDCPDCITQRTSRLVTMSLQQEFVEHISCHCH